MTSPSDLIERLRTERSVYDAELADEAADEIERLQKRVSDADECIEEQEEMLERLTDDVAAMGNECIELRLEIERLRAALERIAEETRDSGYGPAWAVYKIAREALKDE